MSNAPRIVLAMSLLGCGNASGDPDASAEGGADIAPRACTLGLWDPDGSELVSWPDPSLLNDDPSTRTGYRLAFAGRYPDTLARMGGFAPVYAEDLGALDGFGNNAPAFFRFEGAFDIDQLPNGPATSLPAAGLGVAVLEATPRIVPVIVTADDGTLFLAPMQPLPEQTWAVAFVTRALTDAAGGCLEPSPATRALLVDPDPRTREALDALLALDVIDTPDDLIVLAVYPVQSIADDTRAIAAHIETLSPVPTEAPLCDEGPLWRRCVGAFQAFDFRDADGVIRRSEGEPVAPTITYSLRYTVWLPLVGTGPFPTMVWGTGLGTDRSLGERLANHVAPAGFATLAIDPVAHGEHPDVPEGADPAMGAAVFRFFEIGDDLGARTLSPLRLRDNFRQATYDKLQLLRFIADGLDVDGDGVSELDPTRLAYLGASLGGMMGVELLAATDAFRGAVLVLPGGGVASMIRESDRIGPLITLLRPRQATPSDMRRFFPVMQTIIERGDAASYGPHVQRDRFVSGRGSHLLVGMVIDDDTVPNVATYTLMRAMELPPVGTVLHDAPGIAPALPAPTRGNRDGLTGGFLQFDLVRIDGEVLPAEHVNVSDSETGLAAWLPFLQTLFEDDAPVIVDPYEATALAHR